MNQTIAWITFGSVADTASQLYSVSFDWINLLTACGPIMYFPLAGISSWAISYFGLRVTTLTAALLLAIASVTRAFAYNRETFWLVIVGQLFAASAGPIVMTAPPVLSSAWFGAKERTFSTAVGTIANNFGNAAAFLLGMAVSTPHNLRILLYGEAIYMTALFLVVLLHYPALPHTPPSISAAQSNKTPPLTFLQLIKQSAKLMISKNSAIMILCAGLMSGVYGAWQGMLVIILGPLGYNQSQAQRLGLWNAVLGMIGGIVCGRIHDRYFHHYKVLLIILYASSAASFGFFTLVAEKVIKFYPSILALLSNIVIGFVVNGFSPIAYEAVVETSYPTPEAVGAGMISLMNNFATLAFLLCGNYIMPNIMNWLVVGIAGVCFLATFIVTEQYPRSKLDENNTAIIN